MLKELPGLQQLEVGKHLPVVGSPEKTLECLQARPRGKCGCSEEVSREGLSTPPGAEGGSGFLPDPHSPI